MELIDVGDGERRAAGVLPTGLLLGTVVSTLLGNFASGQQAPGQPEPAETQPPSVSTSPGCSVLPDHASLREQLRAIVTRGSPAANGGLGNHMWAVLVERTGVVCVIARSGEAFDDQWPGSRSIAAAKAYTANAFSLSGFALSTANLYWPAQPGNSLYDIAFANPVNALAVYAGEAESWGTPKDPIAGRRIGGTSVFGGGLALYTATGELVGALGVSGDESCTDHIVAWKLRDALGLDSVPDGPSRTGTDNIIFDLTVDPATGLRESASGYGHPTCSPGSERIAKELETTAPVGRQD